jgi:hypothetical protein
VGRIAARGDGNREWLNEYKAFAEFVERHQAQLLEVLELPY